jgi:antitoxin MazE
MKTRIQKWRNSLAVRIPKVLASKAGLSENGTVELSISAGRLVIEPITTERLTLGDLLKGVTDENLHGEWHTGPAVGREQTLANS